MSTPTQRSLALLRKDGWIAEVVEKWIPATRRRKDLWGFCDILCIREDGSVLAVQTTSASNASSRVRKIAESENVGMVRKCGIGIHVHGWKKNSKGRWGCKVFDVS